MFVLEVNAIISATQRNSLHFERSCATERCTLNRTPQPKTVKIFLLA